MKPRCGEFEVVLYLAGGSLFLVGAVIFWLSRR